MFRSDAKESTAAEVEVPDTSHAAFHSLIVYLATDQLKIDTGTQHAFDVMQLARKHRVRRLELLCAVAIAKAMSVENALPLLEAGHAMRDDGLVGRCRRYVHEYGGAVGASGAVEELRDFGVTKGLLRDALLHVGKLSAENSRLRGPA